MQSKCSQPSEKVEVLLCFGYNGSGVVGQRHIIRDLNAQKYEAVHNLHSCPIDRHRKMVCTVPPKVNNELFSLANIEGQIIVLAPHCQILHLPPVSTLIIVSYQTNHSGVVSKFNYTVFF